jgi:hypothetical protein
VPLLLPDKPECSLRQHLICGHNTALAERLSAMEASAPRLVVGFTKNIPRYMQLADFFIGKLGRGSTRFSPKKRLYGCTESLDPEPIRLGKTPSSVLLRLSYRDRPIVTVLLRLA